MENRSAFARAEEFLNYTAGWKWAARLAAAGAAMCSLALFVLFALFVDLVLYRGRVPHFAHLNPAVRAHYEKGWQDSTRDERKQLLHQLDAPIADDQFNAELLPQGTAGREWMWRAQAMQLLNDKVSPDAARIYRDAMTSPGQDSPQLGVAWLVLRKPGLQNWVSWVARRNAWMWRPGRDGANDAYLIGLGLAAIGVAVFRAGFRNLMTYAAATSTLDAATRLRRAVYHHSFRLAGSALHEDGEGEAVAIFGNHIESIREALFVRLTTFVSEPLHFVLFLLTAIALDFWLAIACVLLAAVLTLLGGYLAARFRDEASVEGRRAAGFLRQLRESFAMLRLVKANQMELFNQNRVERQLAELTGATFSRMRGESFYRPLLVFLGTVGGAVSLYLAGYAALHGSAGPGKLILLGTSLSLAYWPLARLLADQRAVQRGRDAAVPVFDYLDRPGETHQVVGAEFLTGVDKSIEFRSVSLRDLDTGRPVLHDVNLRIGAARRVAIVGSSEEEKHALIYLLLRFADPSAGEVRIDDKSIRWLTLESLRAQVGAVLWDRLIFNDTVAHNIGCGDPSVTLPQIIEAAKSAHAHQFIQRLPQGYETPIGDLGHSLRASEQFRIALARTVLKDPSVYIIEEPHTPFDGERKGLIDDTLDRVLAGKTVIFLAHRISTIRSCDTVYLLHQGRIEAAGEHRELLASSDLYKHLHYIEFNEFAGQV